MAVSSYGGFGQGLAQGFGLVQSIYDRQDRKDLAEQRLEADARRDADTAKYRADKLQADATFREQEAERAARAAELTQQYRTKSLGYQAADQARDDQQAAADLAWKKSKDNPANLNAKANFLKEQRESISQKAYDERLDQASNLNQLYTMSMDGTEVTPQRLMEINGLIEKNKGGMFDPTEIVSELNQRAGQELLAFNQQLASGAVSTMSPTLTNTYGRMLGIHKTAAVGKRVDSSFRNAPDYMKDGNHIVVGQMLYSAEARKTQGPPLPGQQSTDAKVTGTMAVIVENTNTGEQYPYFAPVTKNREAYQTEAVPLDVGKLNEGAFANAYMSSEVGPAIKGNVRRARIMQRFGDRKKQSDGTAEFNTAVNAQVESVRKALQGGSNPKGWMMVLSNDEAAPMFGEDQLTESQVAMIRSRVEENLLFDTVATPPQELVSEWLNATTEKLRSIEVGSLRSGRKFTDPNLAEQESVTLDDVIDFDRATPKMISEINLVADSPAKLLKYLTEMQHITK